jgi:UPF0176 protein
MASLRYLMNIVNIAAYQFHPLDQLQSYRESFRQLCRRSELKGTILLSGEGINMFVAGSRLGVDAVLEMVRAIPGFESIPVKESVTDYQPFNRMLVKIKKDIVPVGCPEVSPEPDASPKIPPALLKEWLDQNRTIALLDTRNDYEVSLGTFHNAIDLKLKNFREFPAAAAALPDEIKKQPVVMFCTGGIRCEKIGPYMKGLGFEEIYQLDGGILKYFEDCQQVHYDGECFVFDQRVAVDPSLAPTDIYECYACKHALTPEDCNSPKYREGISCPYCYRDPDTDSSQRRREREARIQSIAAQQHGCQPYENRRWISIPGRCAGLPLIDALESIYPGWNRERWTRAIELGEITAPAATKNEWKTTAVTPERIVREGERFLQTIPNYTEPAIDPRIELVHEDEAIVVVNKGAPLPLHPSGRYQKNTLESILHEAYFPEKLRPAHRIDAMTTGLVVFTRRYAFASKLQPQFAAGTVEKSYLAWVEGTPAWDETECDAPISSEPLPNSGREIAPSLDTPNAQSALTLFRVLERRGNRTLVEAQPKTGRTHQIRLHLAHLGFPIVGDPLYLAGGQSRLSTEMRPPRADEASSSPMLLHASRLAFVHPLTGQSMALEASPWGDAS